MLNPILETLPTGHVRRSGEYHETGKITAGDVMNWDSYFDMDVRTTSTQTNGLQNDSRVQGGLGALRGDWRPLSENEMRHGLRVRTGPGLFKPGTPRKQATLILSIMARRVLLFAGACTAMTV